MALMRLLVAQEDDLQDKLMKRSKVKLTLWDMGTPRSPPTRLTAIPDKWVRPTRRPADLLVGPTDLVGSPHDLLKTFQKIPPDDLIHHNLKTWRTRQDKTSVDFA
jgi:hypothetical protein